MALTMWTLTEVEGITSGRCQNHKKCKRPLDKVRPQGSSEGLSRRPESRPRENSLSICNGDSVRIPSDVDLDITDLPHSRMSRDDPISTATRFPNELRAIKKFKPRTALLDPKTFVKKRLAAI
jgi:hypothetical protein